MSVHVCWVTSPTHLNCTIGCDSIDSNCRQSVRSTQKFMILCYLPGTQKEVRMHSPIMVSVIKKILSWAEDDGDDCDADRKVKRGHWSRGWGRMVLD